MSKIPAVKFELTLWEGPHHLVGRPVVVDTWAAASAALQDWRRQVTRPGEGYWKTGFLVTFADGEDYQGRFDLEHDVLPNLSQHCQREFEFHAGRWCPPRLSRDKYDALVRSRPTLCEEATRFLDEYDLFGSPLPEPVTC